MATVRRFGKPDLFITFTCNPKWPEITSCLRPGEAAYMRPDIICRVFKMKFDQLMEDLTKKNILGKCIAHNSVIEFQKRQLPHAHILLILSANNKIRIINGDYDQIVCAEIPNPVTQPRLHSVVTSHLMHGPCGMLNPHCVCMKDGICTKNFPKKFGHDIRLQTFISDLSQKK
jgi:hypothetical protein